MRLKSAYRGKSAEIISESPAEITEIKIEGTEPHAVAAISTENPPDAESSDAIDAALEEAANADESKLALLRQIEALQQSEALQHQHRAAQMTAIHQPTREQKLELWRAQGMSEAEAHFLNEHPALIDHPTITQAAVAATLQSGIERGTPEFFNAVREGFDTQIRHAQAQGAASAPEFFKPPAPQAPSNNSHVVSAPVTRGEIGGYHRVPSPSQVKLTPAELEIAVASKISPVEYAKLKLKLEREKRAGQRP